MEKALNEAISAPQYIAHRLCPSRDKHDRTRAFERRYFAEIKYDMYPTTSPGCAKIGNSRLESKGQAVADAAESAGKFDGDMYGPKYDTLHRISVLVRSMREGRKETCTAWEIRDGKCQ